MLEGRCDAKTNPSCLQSTKKTRKLKPLKCLTMRTRNNLGLHAPLRETHAANYLLVYEKDPAQPKVSYAPSPEWVSNNSGGPGIILSVYKNQTKGGHPSSLRENVEEGRNSGGASYTAPHAILGMLPLQGYPLFSFFTYFCACPRVSVCVCLRLPDRYVGALPPPA